MKSYVLKHLANYQLVIQILLMHLWSIESQILEDIKSQVGGVTISKYPNFFICTNGWRKPVKCFCQKATSSWEICLEHRLSITIFVWSSHLKYNLLTDWPLAHLETMAQNLISGPTLSAHIVRMLISACGFLLLKWKSSICFIKNYKNTHGILLAFFVIRQQTSNI